MSIHDKHKESKFETEIVEYLTSKDWIEGTSSGYDKKLALYTEDLISYIKNMWYLFIISSEKRLSPKKATLSSVIIPIISKKCPGSLI